jgi:hypothetical protein
VLWKTINNQPSPITNLSRNANERLLKIHQLIAAQRFPNTFSLARDLEVSYPMMRDHWDLPIAFDRTRKGLYYAKRVDKFPGVPTHRRTRHLRTTRNQKSMTGGASVPASRSRIRITITDYHSPV